MSCLGDRLHPLLPLKDPLQTPGQERLESNYVSPRKILLSLPLKGCFELASKGSVFPSHLSEACMTLTGVGQRGFTC